ncbi:hypothetical protein JTB14_016765 [Gonioctena quinquepunctata]|nr:hypothetical protein JTB14_016765 [Gonioctena quinquepunctata]
MRKKCADNKTYFRGSCGGHHVPPPHPPNEEEEELYETISMSIHGLKNPSDSDATQREQSDMPISDGLAVFDELAEKEIIETNWTTFNGKMLQTPLHHGLIVESDHLYPIYLNKEKIESLSEPEEKQNCPSLQGNISIERLVSQRRPVLKKKCQKSVGAKFEDLAMKKHKLIDSVQNAEQSTEEHRIKMQILRHRENVSRLEKKS